MGPFLPSAVISPDALSLRFWGVWGHLLSPSSHCSVSLHLTEHLSNSTWNYKTQLLCSRHLRSETQPRLPSLLQNLRL